jgi:hypothetical protein
MSDPFKNPDQFGAELGAVKYTPAAQGRPQAIDRPSNWGQFSVTERRAFQAVDAGQVATHLFPIV